MARETTALHCERSRRREAVPPTDLWGLPRRFVPSPLKNYVPLFCHSSYSHSLKRLIQKRFLLNTAVCEILDHHYLDGGKDVVVAPRPWRGGAATGDDAQRHAARQQCADGLSRHRPPAGSGDAGPARRVGARPGALRSATHCRSTSTNISEFVAILSTRRSPPSSFSPPPHVRRSAARAGARSGARRAAAAACMGRFC